MWSRETENCVVAPEVLRFIADYAMYRGAPTEKVVDLWAQTGDMLRPLANMLQARSVLGIRHEGTDVPTSGAAGPDAEWVLADPEGPLVHLDTPTDILIGVPPWHWAPRRIARTTVDGRTAALTDDPANVAILDASGTLTPRGLGFFIVGPGVLMRSGPGTIGARFEDFGIHIDGVVELPHRALVPVHGAAQILLVLATGSKAKPFYGPMQLRPNSFKHLLRQQFHHGANGGGARLANTV